MITQKELLDYLKLNTLNTKVHCGDLPSLNGEDYIFVDLLDDVVIPSDDKAIYKTSIQIVVASQDYEVRNTLVSYIKDKLNVSVRYDRQNEYQYFLAYCECEVIFNG